jgi:hypothetical protein
MKTQALPKLSIKRSFTEYQHLNQLMQSRLETVVNMQAIPEILFITSYPPRECGIATYSQDLITALNNKFGHSFKINVCALESEHEIHTYNDNIKYTLNTDEPAAFVQLAKVINDNANTSMVLIQHEFGLFKNMEDELIRFLETITKPVITVFHTVLPGPGEAFKINVQQIARLSDSIIVMTNASADILIRDYNIACCVQLISATLPFNFKNTSFGVK